MAPRQACSFWFPTWPACSPALFAREWPQACWPFLFSRAPRPFSFPFRFAAWPQAACAASFFLPALDHARSSAVDQFLHLAWVPPFGQFGFCLKPTCEPMPWLSQFFFFPTWNTHPLLPLSFGFPIGQHGLLTFSFLPRQHHALLA